MNADLRESWMSLKKWKIGSERCYFGEELELFCGRKWIEKWG